MFQDEARFGRINDVRRCWAPRPVRPLCQAMLTHEYTYAYAAVDVVSGELDSLILPQVNTHCAYFSPSWTAFQVDGGRDFNVVVDGVSV